MDRPRIEWIEEDVSAIEDVELLRGAIKNLVKYIKVLENNAHEERKKVKAVPREGTVGYRAICDKCNSGYIQGHDKYRCSHCNSYMELSECGTVGICHYCECKIPIALNDAFWHGFGEMASAIEKYQKKNPQSFNVCDRSGWCTPFYPIGLDYIESNAKERWVKDYAEKYRYTDKPKPLVIWYPY